MLGLPVRTTTVERSFSQMKLIKSRLGSRISDINLARLMHIAIEGPDSNSVDFNEILDRNNIITGYLCIFIYLNSFKN